MMICKADFEELFPEIFPPAKRNAPKATAHQSNAERLVQQEEDGSRLGAAPRASEKARQHNPMVASHWSAAMRVAAQWALAPRLVAVWPALGFANPDWRPPVQ